MDPDEQPRGSARLVSSREANDELFLRQDACRARNVRAAPVEESIAQRLLIQEKRRRRDGVCKFNRRAGGQRLLRLRGRIVKARQVCTVGAAIAGPVECCLAKSLGVELEDLSGIRGGVFGIDEFASEDYAVGRGEDLNAFDGAALAD